MSDLSFSDLLHSARLFLAESLAKGDLVRAVEAVEAVATHVAAGVVVAAAPAPAKPLAVVLAPELERLADDLERRITERVAAAIMAKLTPPAPAAPSNAMVNPTGPTGGGVSP
jgi:hypothetical protein